MRDVFMLVIFVLRVRFFIINNNNDNNNNNNNDLGRRISESPGDARETSFLFQRISVLVQRFNVVLLHDSLPVSDFTD